MTKFHSGLSSCLKHSSKKEVKRHYFLLLLIVILLVSFLHRHLLHILNDLNDTRSLFPSQLTNDPNLDFSELGVKFTWHVWVQSQENVEDSPQVEWRLVYQFNESVDFHFLDVLNEKLNFACANDNRFEEHLAVNQLFHLIHLLLLLMRNKHPFQNMACHSSDVFCVELVKLRVDIVEIS